MYVCTSNNCNADSCSLGQYWKLTKRNTLAVYFFVTIFGQPNVYYESIMISKKVEEISPENTDI